MKKWKDLNNIQKVGVTAVGAAVIGGITYAASKYIPPVHREKTSRIRNYSNER